MKPASSGVAPGISAEDQKKINTTVYRLPGAGFAEKDGTFAAPPADNGEKRGSAAAGCNYARLDQEILATIFLKVRQLYQKEGGKFPDPVLMQRSPIPIRTTRLFRKLPRRLTAKALADLTDPKTTRHGHVGFAWLKDDGTTHAVTGSRAGAMIQRRGTGRSPPG